MLAGFQQEVFSLLEVKTLKKNCSNSSSSFKRESHLFLPSP